MECILLVSTFYLFLTQALGSLINLAHFFVRRLYGQHFCVSGVELEAELVVVQVVLWQVLDVLEGVLGHHLPSLECSHQGTLLRVDYSPNKQ